MTSNGSLRAWINRHETKVIAAFVGADEPNRAPALRECGSEAEARAWVESEAAELGLPVVWSAG